MLPLVARRVHNPPVVQHLARKTVAIDALKHTVTVTAVMNITTSIVDVRIASTACYPCLLLRCCTVSVLGSHVLLIHHYGAAVEAMMMMMMMMMMTMMMMMVVVVVVTAPDATNTHRTRHTVASLFAIFHEDYNFITTRLNRCSVRAVSYDYYHGNASTVVANSTVASTTSTMATVLAGRDRPRLHCCDG